VTVKSDDGSTTDSFTVIANHLISKFSPSGAPTDPIRIAQGKYINNLVKELRAEAPEQEVVVVGDMNDRHNSGALKAIRGSAKNPLLTNAVYEHVPPAERYTYVFQGAPELIDHVLVTPGMAARVARAGVAHLSADLPYSHTWGTAPIGSSDHDHPYVDIAFAGVGEAAAAAQAVNKP
jgi:predicted extracellular nuclease